MPSSAARRRAAGVTFAPGLTGTAARGAGGAAAGAAPGFGDGGAGDASSGGRRARRCGALADPRQHVADRDLGADRHDQLGDDPRLEALDLDGALLGFDDSDDIAALDPVARLDQPLDERAGLHVGAERRHQEVAHPPRTRPRAAAAMSAGCGNAASSRCGA